MAVFEDENGAQRAQGALQDLGVPPAQISRGSGGDKLTAVRGEMQEEMSKTVVAPGNVGPFTEGMTRGMGWGMLGAVPVGVVIGVVCGLVAAWAVDAISWWLGLLIGGAVGAVAGATAGFVVGGAYHPSFDGEGTNLGAERGISVGVTIGDEDVAARAAQALHAAGALRVDVMAPDGAIVEQLQAHGDLEREVSQEEYQEDLRERRGTN